MSETLVPWQPDRGGCGAGVRRGEGQWTTCDGRALWAGTKRFRHTPRDVWLTFACDRHVDQIDNPRALTLDDRREIEHRRAELAKALRGEAFQRVRPLPNGEQPRP